MDLQHFSGLLGRSAVWKVNARIKRAFTAKSQEAVPANRTNTNVWTVVTHSSIPTDDSQLIAGTEERSQAQVPAESKNSAVPFNIALPSICCWGSYPAGFQVLMTPTAATTVFWCAKARSPEAPRDWRRLLFLLAFKRNLPFPAIEGGKDQEGACFSNVGNNLVLRDKNQDLLLFLVFTGQQWMTNKAVLGLDSISYCVSRR